VSSTCQFSCRVRCLCLYVCFIGIYGEVYGTQVRQVLHHAQICFYHWINKSHHWIKWDVMIHWSNSGKQIYAWYKTYLLVYIRQSRILFIYICSFVLIWVTLQHNCSSAERFDPREHAWSKIANMNTKRGCHALVVLNEKLWVQHRCFVLITFNIDIVIYWYSSNEELHKCPLECFVMCVRAVPEVFGALFFYNLLKWRWLRFICSTVSILWWIKFRLGF
jgi:hypothetical protein